MTMGQDECEFDDLIHVLLSKNLSSLTS